MHEEISVSEIPGVGPKTKGLLEKLGIYTYGDLIRHFPYKYISYPEIISIEQALQTKDGTKVSIQAHISSAAKSVNIRGLHITNSSISDDSGKLDVTWYNMPYISKSLKAGDTYIFYGSVVEKRGRTYMEHPLVFRKSAYEVGRPMPVYSTTRGLKSGSISKYINYILDRADFEESMPKSIIEKYGLVSRHTAVENIHRPIDIDAKDSARRRIVFDEFFFPIYTLKRKENAAALNQYIIKGDEDGELIDILPFRLTDSQMRTISDIKKDMQSPIVMNRLVQGDVGSGKTVVALAALYSAYKNGWQSIMMAPTEVLARQHYATLTAMCEKLSHPPRFVLLTGSMKASEKRAAREAIEKHEIDIILGTHALIQDDVKYNRLALVITDEQHRFGVHQRESLSSKGDSPHVLVMSATPIPRTLAVIYYGDLSISRIEQKPVGRMPIKNAIITPSSRKTAYSFIYDQIKEGHQAYIICPLVESTEDSEDKKLENVTDYGAKLQEVFKGKAKVGILHGQMKEKQKQDIMNDFATKNIDILISTTVIEVGVDVPNATVMMIENAERFGLASLHQLRGRVGRGESQSYAIFVNASGKEEAKKRLQILEKSNDGFFIAEEDLKMRGPGEIFGAQQSGELTLGIADIYNDSSVLLDVGAAINDILHENVYISNNEYNKLEEMSSKYLEKMSL